MVKSGTEVTDVMMEGYRVTIICLLAMVGTCIRRLDWVSILVFAPVCCHAVFCVVFFCFDSQHGDMKFYGSWPFGIHLAMGFFDIWSSFFCRVSCLHAELRGDLAKKSTDMLPSEELSIVGDGGDGGQWGPRHWLGELFLVLCRLEWSSCG